MDILRIKELTKTNQNGPPRHNAVVQWSMFLFKRLHLFQVYEIKGPLGQRGVEAGRPQPRRYVSILRTTIWSILQRYGWCH
jgi:hypothetical protein